MSEGNGNVRRKLGRKRGGRRNRKGTGSVRRLPNGCWRVKVSLTDPATGKEGPLPYRPRALLGPTLTGARMPQSPA